MSWDVYLTTKPCVTCGRADDCTPGGGFNYTSNMWPMLKKAGFDWDTIQGRTAAEALPEIRRVIAEMNADPVGYRSLNPSNGWGDYDGFIRWLDKVADCFRDNPEGVIRISR